MIDFVASSSRWRIALLLLAAASFIMGGAWMGGVLGTPPTSSRYPEPVIASVGWLSIIVFGLFGVLGVKRLIVAGEELRVGSSGIRWRRWSEQTIPWTEVTDVTTWSLSGQNVIVLHLRDGAKFPGKGLLAASAGVNRKMTGGDISISVTGTDRRFAEALAAIEKFRSSGS
jgi:hypothetical protein